MATSVSYNTLQWGKPGCASCGSAHTELIDAVYNEGSSQKTEPVYHCHACGKLNVGRSYDVQNELDNFHSAGTVTVFSEHDNNSKQTVDTIVSELVSDQYSKTGQSLKYNQQFLSLQTIIDSMEERLKRAEEIAADPLTDLKRRVASFTLE